MLREVHLTPKPLDQSAIASRLRLPGCGAVVIFEGITRSPDAAAEEVTLEVEAWEDRAHAGLLEILNRHYGALEAAIVHHRTGLVGPAEATIIVGVASAHRAAAFEAAEAIMDSIKHEVPIWKREITKTRSEWISGQSMQSAR